MNDVLQKPHPLIASDPVEGTAVRRPNGERIGHVERLMIDKITGSVSYALSVSAASSAWERTCFVFPGGGGSPTVRDWKPTNSTLQTTNFGVRRRFGRTRISIGATARKKPSCIAIAGSSLTGTGSKRFRTAGPQWN